MMEEGFSLKKIKKEDIVSWGALLVVVLFIWFVLSDGQFSLIFTLAGTVQTFGFALIIVKIRRSRSVTGLSRETFINYTIIFGVRSVIFFLYNVQVGLCRGTCPTIRLGILCLKYRSGWPWGYLPISCTA